jgi:hypothetical protein
VGDPVQPRSQAQLTAVGAQAGISANEHILEHILGVGMLSCEHLTHVCEQPSTVPVVDDPESVLVPVAEQPDELLVRAEPEKRSREPDPTPS